MGQLVDAVRRVASGGTVLDPHVVAQLLSRHAHQEPLQALTTREREVLRLMAEGRSNAAIASALLVTEKTVRKHTNSIFGKLGLPPSEDDNRRVLAVVAYLNAERPVPREPATGAPARGHITPSLRTPGWHDLAPAQ